MVRKLTAEGERKEITRMKCGGKIILVAIQMDSDGQDLISWALDQATEPGDRVVAIHVYRKSDLHSRSLFSLTKAFDDYLAESSCNAKQVVLIGRVAQGSSIKKTVVNEAVICEANTVVVGVNKNMSFRGSGSLYKYCARKLPPTISLFAIHNGKVTFERKAAISYQVPDSQLVEGSTRPNLGTMLHPSLSMKSEATTPDSYKDENRNLDETSSIASSYKDSMDDSFEGRENDEKRTQHKCGSMRPLSMIMEKFPEKPSGWPFLRSTKSMDLSTRKDEETRSMSVVQWVMGLPDRSQQSPQSQEESSMSSGPFGPENLPAYADLCKKVDAILERNSHAYRWFSRVELEESTSHFSPDNLIGKGGSGHVYKGCLPDGKQIAVKISKLSEEALQAFVLEADIITSLQHNGILRIIGMCIDESDIISVYDFFSKGSLEENLHGKKAKPPLPWSARYKVALGIAEALDYLHTTCPSRVIHRDVKSSNILLSDEFKPQLSDFGLAVWLPNSLQSITYSDVVGTFGYLAPEYFMYGKVSEKIDVYSFGVVLLELLTGRKPICSESSKEQESLVMWGMKMLDHGYLMDLLDSTIEIDGNKDQIQRMMLAASISIRRVARLRPKMRQVLALLRGEEAIEGWMSSHSNSTSEEEYHDEEDYPASSVASHLGVALKDIDDATSMSSIELNHRSLEDYLHGCWSRSSSFD